MIQRALGPVVLALAFAAPLGAAAQPAPAGPPDSLAAATSRYFTAVSHADAAALGSGTSETFHIIQADGTRLSFDAFIRQVSTASFIELAPMGNSQRIKSSAVTASGATETVDTRRWFYGAISDDPMSAPKTEFDLATHQLTWIRSADGRWLLDEDHITWALNT